VYGREIGGLYQIVNSLKVQLRQTPGVTFVNDDWGIQTKKLLVSVNQDRALRAGVTNEDVATSLQASLSGIELTQYRENDDLIPITMRSNSAERQDIGKLDNINVFSSSGEAVPLKQVADITLGWQNAIIKRRDRDKAITVQALLLPGVTATEVGTGFFPWLAEQADEWDEGFSYELGGESETSGDANEAIAAKLPVSGMLIVLLLVAQFNSVRKPLIILSTIPLGLIGITVGLLAARTVFGFFTLLGLISLSGIIINNAIVLIDRIKIESEDNGLPINQAIIEACQQRLRPILLTTATTIGGMLPLWISHDPMFETMAVSIIFGLLFATMLTLAVVPVLYSIFFRVDFKSFEYQAKS
jgi:multidrug efflux pump subunit AcrB